ncbi:MAG: hypothetical protein FJ086_19180, partial [Deltaproteobacteria bacterium]|nr:hypothetical protein [Deltaproteobacteria bacterium]
VTCDKPETCTGTSSSCPINAYQSAGSAGSPACSPYTCGGTAQCATTCSATQPCAAGLTCGATGLCE